LKGDGIIQKHPSRKRYSPKIGRKKRGRRYEEPGMDCDELVGCGVEGHWGKRQNV
jgi:hypothetical protein